MQLPPKPEYIDDLEFARILTPYVFTRQIVRARNVLDVGCGSGHGTWLFITNGAERVAAFDIDEANIRRISQFGGFSQNNGALVMDAQRLAFKDHSFQLATCFEVIEHVPRPDMLLSELRRVLKTDGILLVTTPNRAVRLLPYQRPWNPEHLREYTLTGFRRSLERHFCSFAILGIYGRPALHDCYRKKWQQSPIRGYLGWPVRILRNITPEPVRRWVRSHHHHSISARSSSFVQDLLKRALRDPVPENWPFYVSDVGKDCLNFFAICSFDDRVIQRTVHEITQSVYRLPPF